MITKVKKTIFTIFIMGLLFAQYSFILCKANFDILFENNKSSEQITDDIVSYTSASTEEQNYTNYLSEYSNYVAKNANQEFLAKDVVTNDVDIINEDDSYGYGQKVIKLENKQTALFNLNVEKAGLYEIYIDYYFISSSINDTEVSFKINNETPYYEAKQALLKAKWIPNSSYKEDRYGHEIVPSSYKLLTWYKYSDNLGQLSDGSRLYGNTFKGYFNKGENSFSLEIITGSILIGKITLQSEKEVKTYDEYLNNYKNEKVIKELEIVEPETIHSKSDPSIRIASDNDPSNTPYNTKYKKLNSVYMNSYNKGNQTITWKIDVTESGLYNLSFKYIQTELVDLPVFRTIFVNNEVPYKELENYPFYYTKKWTNERICVDDEMAYIYLEEGTNYISMTSSLDPYRNIIERLSNVLDEMSDISLQIKALTNGQSDEYRDWEISKHIKDLDQYFYNWATELEEIIELGNKFTNNKRGSSEFSNLKLAVKKLRKLAEDVDQIPNKMTEFTDGDSSVSQYIGNVMLKLYNTPLGLEKIYLGTDKLPSAKANFFVKFFEAIKKFFLSFFSNDYNTDSKDTEEVEVWVRRSRQYIEVMQMMVDEAGLNVKFSIMPDQNKLVLANSSGDLPDAALGIDNWIPYDLALRGITVDLRDFEGYEEVVSNLTPGALIPYVHEDGMYGLPENQDFWVLFYRTDIMNELGIEIPNTWDDVIGILPKLQRYGLNFYEPISLYTGLRPFNVTLPFFYQWGGSLYSEDGMTTTLSSEENIKAMKFMTDLFTIYNLDKEVTNFYSAFRYGTLPIGIANAGTYLQLTVAAPEIKGNWDIALHPGYETSNGEVLHYACASSQGLTMFKSSDQKEETWEFIKWWMSTETQSDFITRLYSMYGEEYLWFSANLEAFDTLPIPNSHKELIKKQLSYAIEVSRIPAAYSIEQSISDAFSQVVFNGENVRIALDNAVISSNREVARKMEEFGYMKDGEKVKDYLVPTIYNIDYWLKERK